MKPPDWLKQSMAELTEARRHLNYSFEQVAALPATLTDANEANLESVEAFTSRFARCVDLLTNKVLRSLDEAELRTRGTLLDVINRAEQRGFVGRAADLREMKEIRNMIAHDYAAEKAGEIFAYCREQKPIFDAICDRVKTYTDQVLAKYR